MVNQHTFLSLKEIQKERKKDMHENGMKLNESTHTQQTKDNRRIDNRQPQFIITDISRMNVYLPDLFDISSLYSLSS